MNNRNLLLTVLEASGVSSWCQHVQGLVRAVISSQGRKKARALWGLFYKSTDPIHKGSVLIT